jgi:hypothetical protein
MVVNSLRKSGTFRRVGWFCRWRLAASEVARQLEAERWRWARSWGLRKATEAVMYFGCDLHRDARRTSADVVRQRSSYMRLAVFHNRGAYRLPLPRCVWAHSECYEPTSPSEERLLSSRLQRAPRATTLEVVASRVQLAEWRHLHAQATYQSEQRPAVLFAELLHGWVLRLRLSSPP